MTGLYGLDSRKRDTSSRSSHLSCWQLALIAVPHTSSLSSSLAHIAYSEGSWCLCRYVDLKSLSSVTPGYVTTSLNSRCNTPRYSDVLFWSQPRPCLVATWPGPHGSYGLAGLDYPEPYPCA